MKKRCEKSPKIICVIAARGGSKGVPGKNTKLLLGKPLIAYAIGTALQSRYLDRVIVSTEDRQIADIARKYGAEIPFMRPKELAGDNITVIPVYKHALETMDKIGYRADIQVGIQANSPLLSVQDIDTAIEKLLKTNCECILTMKRVEEEHPFRIYNMADDRVLPFNEYTSEENIQRQDRPPAYKFNGAVVVRKRHLLDEWSGKDIAWGKDRRGVLMPQERSVDINEPLDFILCEAILRRNIK